MTNRHETAARAAGWTIGTFGPDNVQKWWNPSKDDGARYVVDDRACRKICEDYKIVVSAWDMQRRARALAITICAIWETWSDIHEDARDDALRLAFEQVRALDMIGMSNDIAFPLDYFTTAYLDEVNPDDLTYDEMVQAIAEGLALASLSPVSASDATGN